MVVVEKEETVGGRRMAGPNSVWNTVNGGGDAAFPLVGRVRRFDALGVFSSSLLLPLSSSSLLRSLSSSSSSSSLLSGESLILVAIFATYPILVVGSSQPDGTANGTANGAAAVAVAAVS